MTMAEKKKSLKDLTIKDIMNECDKKHWDYDIYETADGDACITYFPHDMVQYEAIAKDINEKIFKAFEHYVTYHGIETVQVL